jgi:hypothetical protein
MGPSGKWQFMKASASWMNWALRKEALEGSLDLPCLLPLQDMAGRWHQWATYPHLVQNPLASWYWTFWLWTSQSSFLTIKLTLLTHYLFLLCFHLKWMIQLLIFISDPDFYLELQTHNSSFLVGISLYLYLTRPKVNLWSLPNPSL